MLHILWESIKEQILLIIKVTVPFVSCEPAITTK